MPTCGTIVANALHHPGWAGANGQPMHHQVAMPPGGSVGVGTSAAPGAMWQLAPVAAGGFHPSAGGGGGEWSSGSPTGRRAREGGSGGGGADDDLSRDAKKARRMERKADAARESRLNKKGYRESLQRELTQLRVVMGEAAAAAAGVPGMPGMSAAPAAGGGAGAAAGGGGGGGGGGGVGGGGGDFLGAVAAAAAAAAAAPGAPASMEP